MFDFSALPTPSPRNISVRVKPAAERAIRQGHPWVFDDSIVKQSHLGNAGDLAVIYDRDKNGFLAVGLYDPLSPIRIKILQAGEARRIDRRFFSDRLAAAEEKRDPLISQGTTGYRLVYGESDGFPALVIDRYGETVALKLYTTAWIPHLAELAAALKDNVAFDSLVLRLSRNLQSDRLNVASLYGLHDGQQLIGETAQPTQFVENGLIFTADTRRGHKTGFFFDQRENRQRVRELAKGRRMLDAFCYTGGFSVYALAGGARSVVAIDGSQPALDALRRNVTLNGFADESVDALRVDAFAGMSELIEARRKFGLLVVDPPAFANRRANMGNAVTAYRRLVELALQLMEDDAILVMSSCSSRINPIMFKQLVTRAASVAGRELEVFDSSAHALDHPIGFPEAAYMKALFCRFAP